jgi:hypothetical protein
MCLTLHSALYSDGILTIDYRQGVVFDSFAYFVEGRGMAQLGNFAYIALLGEEAAI